MTDGLGIQHRVDYDLDTDQPENRRWRIKCTCGAKSGRVSFDDAQRIKRAHLDLPPTDEDVAADREATLAAIGGPAANPLYADDHGRTVRTGITQFNSLDCGLAASGR